ncbi:MAG: CPBP family intramembrane metalloprotease [Clostridia bacterium]|nr:CPBP family intramembrane metalloprotease [Clostridia bacterium]
MNETNNYNIPENQDKIYNAPSSLYFPTKRNSDFYQLPHRDPKDELKTEIRKTVNKASLGLLIFYGCGIIFQAVILIIAFIYSSNGAAAYNEFVNFVSEPTFNLLLNSFYQAVFMTLPFVLAAAISKQRPSDILIYNKPKKNSVLPFAILGLGGAMLCNLANSIIYSLFSLFGATPQGGNIDMDMGIKSLFLNLVTIAVIPALFEEFAYRGIFMGLLRKKLSCPASIIISAAAFGLIHGNFAQMPFAFLMGLLLGYLYAASGSLWVPMLVHLLNNSYSVILDHITHSMPSSEANIVFYLFLLIFLLSGIAAFCYIVKKRPEILNIEKEEEKLISTSGMLKIGFSSPIFIISAALFIVDAVVKQFSGAL